nr:imidazolonepropionase [uncultured Holophaga sp.]
MSPRLLVTDLAGLFSPDPGAAWGMTRILDAAICLEHGRVAWMGPARDLPPGWQDVPRVEGRGRWATPGFVDPHTHLLFAGDRSSEFNRRLHGESAAQIAREGGGIRATVRATRRASLEELIALGEARLRAFRERGVVHLEAKTGYGLDLETESRLLEAYARLQDRGWSLDLTLMPAHELPDEYQDNPEGFIRAVAEHWQPELLRQHPGRARFCDVFVEKGVFSPEQGRRILASGLALGLRPRLHADELSWTGGAELAAELGAASADHLMHVSAAGTAALATSGVVPVLLPATPFFLGLGRCAPARRLIEAGCAVALGSDFNPGTSPCLDPLLILRLACLQMGMNFEEAFIAMTLHAARSLGREDLGHLHPGARSPLLLWELRDPLELVYWIGASFRPELVG